MASHSGSSNVSTRSLSEDAENQLVREYAALSKLWFPRFEDQAKELAFCESSIDAPNRSIMFRMGIILLIAVPLANARGYYGGIHFEGGSLTRGGAMLLASNALMEILSAAMMTYPYLHNCRERQRGLPVVGTEPLIAIFHVLGALLLFTTNSWRVGVVAEGNGYHFYDTRECVTDQFLVESLLLLSMLSSIVLVVRSRLALILMVLPPCMYVISCLPNGWSPTTRVTNILYNAVVLLAWSSGLWLASQKLELGRRKEWLRSHKLQSALQQLEADRLNPNGIDSPNDCDTSSGAWIYKWVGQHVQNTLSIQYPDMEVDGFWCVNASPFNVHVLTENFNIDLSAKSFCRTSAALSGKMSLRMESNESEKHLWKQLSSSVIVTIETEDWTIEGYDNDVVRKELPNNVDGLRMGCLKLVRGPNDMFLFSWSPPPEGRGMPVYEFVQFLENVINSPGQWECRDNCEVGGGSVIKRMGDHRRNMYDACLHFIMPRAGPVDFSYAELYTEFGPPEVFVSHVWGEEAGNTLAAIRSFMVGKSSAMQAIPPASSDNTSSLMRKSSLGRVEDTCRIWFCTRCNNQTRVTEELGTCVSESPFARVIRSPVCMTIAVISPLLALSRKWCNYEFCLAHAASKNIALVTNAGIVQAGQVPPKDLHDLAVRSRNFFCADATCTSTEDAAMIDDAVAAMGGYEGLDANLKACFAEAIYTAHAWTSQALQEIVDPLQGSHAMTNQGEQSDMSDSSVTIDSFSLVGRTSL